MSAKRSLQSLKIIAGDLRGRRIEFYETAHLRPTGARIRETLFNWLQPMIYGKTCLDLFAGSGILGLEAVSRGAKQVTFVEKNTIAAKQLQQQLKQLNTENTTLINSDYRQVIQSAAHPFDIIFLDPPYDLRLLPQLLDDLKTLSPQWVFIEDNQPFETWLSERDDYCILKSKKAGNIYYGLLAPIHDTL